MVQKGEIESIRDKNYRRIPELFVHTEDEAIEFINEVGFCFLFPQKYELPSLWGAMCDYSASSCGWDDPIAILIWGDGKTTLGWRDTLPKSRQVFFGKVIAQKPSFISLEYLPYFYACYGVFDYMKEYQAGKMSHLAKNIYELLFEEGPIPTKIVRTKVGMSGKENTYKFDRAMVELQTNLLIAKVDVVPGSYGKDSGKIPENRCGFTGTRNSTIVWLEKEQGLKNSRKDAKFTTSYNS